MLLEHEKEATQRAWSVDGKKARGWLVYRTSIVFILGFAGEQEGEHKARGEREARSASHPRRVWHDKLSLR